MKPRRLKISKYLDLSSFVLICLNVHVSSLCATSLNTRKQQPLQLSSEIFVSVPDERSATSSRAEDHSTVYGLALEASGNGDSALRCSLYCEGRFATDSLCQDYRDVDDTGFIVSLAISVPSLRDIAIPALASVSYLNKHYASLGGELSYSWAEPNTKMGVGFSVLSLQSDLGRELDASGKLPIFKNLTEFDLITSNPMFRDMLIRLKTGWKILQTVQVEQQYSRMPRARVIKGLGANKELELALSFKHRNKVFREHENRSRFRNFNDLGNHYLG